MKFLTGKTILLTGAAGGLGHEYTKQLLELGAHLVLTDLDQSAPEAMSGLQKNTPGTIKGYIAADISSVQGCTVLYEKIKEISPNIDMLINNAGIISYGYFHDIPDTQLEKLIQVNLLAPMWLSKLFVPDMIQRGQGHLVFTCSLAGIIGTSQSTAYAASKFGMRGFAVSLADEVKNKGIATTIIYPSWIKTKLLDSPEFGSSDMKSVPPLFAENPMKVVRESIKGIRKNRRHIYPGPVAKFMAILNKIKPVVVKQAH